MLFPFNHRLSVPSAPAAHSHYRRLCCGFSSSHPLHFLFLSLENRSEKQLFAMQGTLFFKAVPGREPLISLGAASYRPVAAEEPESGVTSFPFTAILLSYDCRRYSRVCDSNVLLTSHVLYEPRIVCRRSEILFLSPAPPPPPINSQSPPIPSYIIPVFFQGRDERDAWCNRDHLSLIGKHTHG